MFPEFQFSSTSNFMMTDFELFPEVEVEVEEEEEEDRDECEEADTSQGNKRTKYDYVYVQGYDTIQAAQNWIKSKSYKYHSGSSGKRRSTFYKKHKCSKHTSCQHFLTIVTHGNASYCVEKGGKHSQDVALKCFWKKHILSAIDRFLYHSLTPLKIVHMLRTMGH